MGVGFWVGLRLIKRVDTLENKVDDHEARLQVTDTKYNREVVVKANKSHIQGQFLKSVNGGLFIIFIRINNIIYRNTSVNRATTIFINL